MNDTRLSFLRHCTFRPDAGLLFDPNTGIEMDINGTGSTIVAGLLQGLSELQVSESLSAEYGIPLEEAMKDVTEFLQEIMSPEQVLEGFEFEKVLASVPEFPFSLEIELTRSCNWNCGFCYNTWKAKNRSSGLQATSPHLATSRVKKILDECRSEGLLRVRYSGGEPTLHPEFPAILEHGASLGLYQVIFTNGHSLDKTAADLWASANVKEVLVSIHGTEAMHDQMTGRCGAYAQAVSAILNALAAGLAVVIEITLTGANCSAVLEVIRDFRCMGVRDFRIMRYVPRGRDDARFLVPADAISKLMEYLDALCDPQGIRVLFPCSLKYCLSETPHPRERDDPVGNRDRYLMQHCHAGLTWVSISYDEKLRVCPHSDVILADLAHEGQSLKAAWDHQVKNLILMAFEEQHRECGTCYVWHLCKGGCYLERLATLRDHHRFCANLA